MQALHMSQDTEVSRQDKLSCMHTKVSVHLHIERCVKIAVIWLRIVSVTEAQQKLVRPAGSSLQHCEWLSQAEEFTTARARHKHIQKSSWGQTAKDKSLRQLLAKMPLTQLQYVRSYLLLQRLSSAASMEILFNAASLQTHAPDYILSFHNKTRPATYASCCAWCASQLDLRQQLATQPAETHMV